MSEASYTAWDDNLYEWPPPDGWYEASDGRWWPEGYGPAASVGDGASPAGASAAASPSDEAGDGGRNGSTREVSFDPDRTSVFPAGGFAIADPQPAADRRRAESQRPVYDELPPIDDVFGGIDPYSTVETPPPRPVEDLTVDNESSSRITPAGEADLSPSVSADGPDGARPAAGDGPGAGQVPARPVSSDAVRPNPLDLPPRIDDERLFDSAFDRVAESLRADSSDSPALGAGSPPDLASASDRGPAKGQVPDDLTRIGLGPQAGPTGPAGPTSPDQPPTPGGSGGAFAEVGQPPEPGGSGGAFGDAGQPPGVGGSPSAFAEAGQSPGVGGSPSAFGEAGQPPTPGGSAGAFAEAGTGAGDSSGHEPTVLADDDATKVTESPFAAGFQRPDALEEQPDAWRPGPPADDSATAPISLGTMYRHEGSVASRHGGRFDPGATTMASSELPEVPSLDGQLDAAEDVGGYVGAPSATAAPRRWWPLIVIGIAVLAVAASVVTYLLVRDDGSPPDPGVDTDPTAAGSFANPYAMGTGVVVYYNDTASGEQRRWVIQVTEAVADATDELVADASAQAPADGEILARARIRVTYQRGPEPGTLADLRFNAAGSVGADFDQTEDGCSAVNEPLDRGASLNVLESVEGEICWQIPATELANLKLAVEAGPAAGRVHLLLQ